MPRLSVLTSDSPFASALELYIVCQQARAAETTHVSNVPVPLFSDVLAETQTVIPFFIRYAVPLGRK